MSIRELKAESRGLADLIDRESRTMDPLQFFREAVQNEIEAGATKIIIDSFNGKSVRVTGNGHGMTEDQLVKHLSTVLTSSKGSANYGIGARVAALPHNHAGVIFASRTVDGEGMIQLIREGNAYGLKQWSIKGIMHEVVLPTSGQLSNLLKSSTGTAVILLGDGTKPTWNSGTGHAVHNYLARRYYEFPEGVVVQVLHKDKSRHTVRPMGQSLQLISTADGAVPFKDVQGLSGAIFWWILSTPEERRHQLTGHDNFTSGVGLVVDNEVFNYSNDHMTDFGIHFKSVRNRICILIAIQGAEMDTSRNGVVFPGKNSERSVTPWKALGAYFSEHMPEEIDELASKIMPSATILSEEQAKKLDPDWMKWIHAIKVIVPAKNGKEKTGNEDDGEAVPTLRNRNLFPDPDPNPNPGPGPFPGPSPHTKPQQQKTGNKPGEERSKTVTPKVRFVPAEEMPLDEHPFHMYWSHTDNTVFISEQLPPYQREIRGWLEKTDLSRSLIEEAVKLGYATEFSAYIIDVNVQRKAGLTQDNIDHLLKDGTLYGKTLSCQALTQTIERYLDEVVKTAS